MLRQLMRFCKMKYSFQQYLYKTLSGLALVLHCQFLKVLCTVIIAE